MTTAEKTLRKMLAAKDPVAWLAAADMIEEQGGDGARLRCKAELTLAIRAAFLAGQSILVSRWTRGERTPYGVPVPVNDDLQVNVRGGSQILSVTLVIYGPAVVFHCYDGSVTLDESRPGLVPVSRTIDIRRDLMARPDYLDRRAAELADEAIAPVGTYAIAARKALDEYHDNAEAA